MNNLRKKRTNFDFSKHELIIKETDDLKIHQLKLPDTITEEEIRKVFRCRGRKQVIFG